MIAVKEFISDLHEGYTNAFLCRADDGFLYVAKSRRSGRESLVREWICGRIGREFGLPIPAITQLYADHAVAAYSANEQILDLASEPGFGSRFVGDAQVGLAANLPTLNVADVSSVDDTMRCRVLLFDWWILNFDRADDNPNLLWSAVSEELHVIDHNLAFDDSPKRDFWDHHIFRQSRHEILDPGFRAEQIDRMAAILWQLSGFWAELPNSWTEASTMSFERMDAVLRRCLADDFLQAT